MRTVAVASMKGGVGKSTVVVTLAALYASRGVRVLVLDMDAQGHAAAYLGAARGDGAYRLLTETGAAAETVTRAVRPNLDVVASNARVAFAEHLLRERLGVERTLTRRLAELQEGYDVCLIDVPPGFGLVSSVALYAAQAVLIPVVPGHGPERGVVDLIGRLSQMRAEVDRAPLVMGVIPNMLDARERESRALLSFTAGQPVAPAIRRSVRVPESVRRGVTVSESDPGGTAARDYRALSEWTAQRLGAI